jgi:putative heme transporter
VAPLDKDKTAGPAERSPGPLGGGAAAIALPAAGAVRLAAGPRRPAHRPQTLLRNLAIMAIALGVVAALYSERSITAKGLDNLKDLNWAWVAAASLVEGLSMLAFAMLYRDLLRANGRRLRLTWILAASLSANAISVAVPVVGSGMAGRQMFRWFREGGADPAAATLALTVAGVVSAVTLASVATAAALLSSNPAAAAGGVFMATAMVGLTAGIAVGIRTESGRARLLYITTLFIRGAHRAVRKPSGQPEKLAKSVLASLQRLELNANTLGRVLLFGLVNWWADVACLAFAMKAAGIDVSIAKMLLVWTAGAGAASLSPTPAGIGAVEVGMIAAMAGVGVKGTGAITSVLVYRVIFLKGAGSLGAYVYATFHRRWTAQRRRATTPFEDFEQGPEIARS